MTTILEAPRRSNRPWRADRPFPRWRRSKPRLEGIEDRTLLSSFNVTNTGDSGPGSLRQAILDSNNDTKATNTIDFDIPGGGVQTIVPVSGLPAITRAALIDGWSQPGFVGTPLIELDGSQAGTGDGLTITAPNVTVRGLDIGGFALGAGIHLMGTSATRDWIYGTFLGTDPTGTQALPNNEGVEIDGGAVNNLVGTNGDGVNDTAERNLVSGNQSEGVWIDGQGASGNIIAGNLIGTDITGGLPLGNGGPLLSDSQGDSFGGGVAITGGASGNRIGTDGKSTDDVGERNVISGNNVDGVDVVGIGTMQNVVAGNLIGTDLTGNLSMGNGQVGVEPAFGASFNWIGVNPNGGVEKDEGNIISGNGYAGVHIFGGDDNVVAGNEIGTDTTGTLSLPNTLFGIDIVADSKNNTIGGATAASGNLITNNAGPGVVVGYDQQTLDISIGNQITANRIFGNKGQSIDLGDDGVTYNDPSPRPGPNNFQHFPVIVAIANGQLQGWLWGSTSDTTFRIDVFASSAYGPGGAGEAEDYLGSMEVTTDSQGQITFNLPFIAPAGLPIITATATDPQGNTSEVSASRRASLKLPPPSIRVLPDQPLIFSTASGDGIMIQDPDAGPLDPIWDLALSVTSGTLMLAGTTGLTGHGDGTGSLSYSGHLSALDAALNGLAYTPKPGPHVLTTLTLNAKSPGAASLERQLVLTDGAGVVDTTADSGPGSLRQVILDANNVTGGTVTIDFAIPGSGIQTIEPITPLPPIAASVLIDGTSQPGFSGTPLIALSGQSPGSPAPLAIASPNVTIRGLAIDSVAIDATTDELLIAVVHAEGATTQLSLLDSRGQVLVHSAGLSRTNPDDEIAQHLPSGTYYLQVQSAAGKGTYTLTTDSMPASAPFQPIKVRVFPDALVAGDFADNGRLDLAIANYGDNTVSVLLGNGDGTFQLPVTYQVGLGPYALVTGDFAGTGHLDLAVANFNDNTVALLLGNGDGTFQPQEIYAVGSGPSGLVAGDFKGDGHLDLAVADFASNDVSVLLGNGDGTFQPATKYAAGPGPAAIVAGDFNGDGHLDLAVADSFGSSNVAVLLGNGDGTFQPASLIKYAATSFSDAIVAGDFTGDGHLDLAVADAPNEIAGTVSVLLGNGDGTFQPAIQYRVGWQPYSLVAGDFAGDGHLDLVTANSFSNDVSVLLGSGDGTFQPARQYRVALAPASLVAGDFAADGRLDLAVANSYSNDVTILLGKGDGTFETTGQREVASHPGAIVTGDFNGDGRLNMAVADQQGDRVAIFLGNGDGTFQPAVQYSLGPLVLAVTGIMAGDFNGDGRLDLAVVYQGVNFGPGGISVLLGNGDGTFQPARQYALGTAADMEQLGVGSIVAGDFNRDGRLDRAAIDGESNDVSVLLGNGDGTFQPAVPYALGSLPVYLVAGDFAGNGRLDLAVADSAGIEILLGNGDGTFQAAQTVAPGIGGPLLAVDFNGHLDLVGVELDPQTGASEVAVLLGNGDGTFQPARIVATGIGQLVAGDFNGDGKIDLAVTGSDPNTGAGEVSVLLGNGDGTFQPAIQHALAWYPGSLVAGDFNGDGKLDVAVDNPLDGTVSVLLGNGDGTLADPSQLAAAPHAGPLVADLNGDGTDDVLVVDGAGNILYRQGIPEQPGSFEPPVTVNPGNPSRDIAWLPNTDQGPVLASVDAQDDAISFYAYRNGAFVRLNGSLTTGKLPAQIIAARLNGDGLTDLVVRNAGDGSLSLYYATTLNAIGFIGPVSAFAAPNFLGPTTFPVGIGLSDVRAVDTTGGGALDLVVTNTLSGQVSVLLNLGGGVFAPPVLYRAGTGLSEINPGSSPEVSSLQATAGVAAGPRAPGGPTDLVTINPGSNTLDVLAGLGGGRFANPVIIGTPSAAQVVRVADFSGNGVSDVAVLTAKGVSIYLGNGKGGFAPPVTYDAGVNPTGLSIADLLGNGRLDLLVGNAYGDVLILVGNGDGSFRPFEPVKSAVALAVADLTGNGVLDFVFADQSLNRVTVVYGSTSQSATNPQVIGNQTTGVLAPGAVLLHDMNGDNIPDLVVANSGGNNVLVYPGLGNGQFGPPVNGTAGFPVGTDPTGLAVADLPDPSSPDHKPVRALLVADTGSNDVSVLLSQGSGPNWTMIPGPRVQTDPGPVAVAVGNLLGGTQTDLAVANSGANDVEIFPGVGGGFFDNKPSTTVTVGQAPSSLFVGNFNGLGQGLATLNAGSNDGTLITGLGSARQRTQTFPTGGDSPTSGFAGDFTGNGFTDLVVGNNGDGDLALLMGGSNGLSLSQTLTSAEAPNPTSLSFAGVSDGLLSFYVSTAGREAALSLAFNLEGGAGVEPGSLPVAATSTGETSVSAVLTLAATGSVQQVSQLLSFTGTTLNLAATLLSVSVLPGNFESESGGAVATAGAVGLGQPVVQPQGKGGPNGSGEEAGTDDAGSVTGQPAAAVAPLWERLSIGLERAWEQARAAIRELESRAPRAGDPEPTARPAVSPPPRLPVPAPIRPRTGAGSKTGSKRSVSVVSIATEAVTSDQAPDAASRAIDAALEDLGSQQAHDGLSAGARLGFREVLAEGEPAAKLQTLVAVAASVAAAGAAWTAGGQWVRRRRHAPTGVR
jgi:hypothetical protein